MKKVKVKNEKQTALAKETKSVILAGLYEITPLYRRRKENLAETGIGNKCWIN
jgi:hypothetical protein